MKSKWLFLSFLFCVLQYAAQAQYSRYIVQLKNKSGTTFSINRPEAFLSQRAIAKRIKYGIAIDSTDLPVVQSYLDSIRLSGTVSILNTSKWLNQVCIETTDTEALNKIAAFPFVQGMAAMAQRQISLAQQRKFGIEENIRSMADSALPQPELSNVYNYGQSYHQVHLQQGEFLHNYGFSGQGMQMAILDAGFRNHQILPTFDSIRNNGQVLGTWDFVSNHTNVNDDNSHGTHCFSTIAANMPGSFVGTAPKSAYYLFRTEDVGSEFPIEEQNLAAGLERADSLGVDVASISLGYFEFDDYLLNHSYADMNGNTTIAARAADFAAHKGMLVVAAAGNEGDNDWHYIITPADADSVLAVGAVDSFGIVANFSSYGPSSDGQIKPSVTAMGVWSTIANAATGQPAQSSGTSFATPIMAGLATCLWQAFPQATNMQIIQALQQAGTHYSNPNDSIGHGTPSMKKAFVILLKQFYTQQIQLAGCETILNWHCMADSNMRFIIEKKLPADAGFSPVDTLTTTGSFGMKQFNYRHSLSALPTPVSIDYRIKMELDTDSSFYFNTVTVLHPNACMQYVFTGNGNWTDAGNWLGNTIPPNPLPAGSSIIINPDGTGECILNIHQQINAGGIIEVMPGKNLTVKGNLTTQ